MKEIYRAGLRKSKNYQSYEANIEEKIEYDSIKQRKILVLNIFNRIREDLRVQMDMDK